MLTLVAWGVNTCCCSVPHTALGTGNLLSLLVGSHCSWRYVVCKSVEVGRSITFWFIVGLGVSRRKLDLVV